MRRLEIPARVSWGGKHTMLTLDRAQEKRNSLKAVGRSRTDDFTLLMKIRKNRRCE